MKFRAALVFVAVGAILRFAVTAETSWIRIQTIGLILMLVGVFGLLFRLYRSGVAYSRRRRERLAAVLAGISDEPEPYKPEQPDPTLLTELETAHHLAQEALPFLEAEGFTEGRVHELALAFAAKGVGLDHRGVHRLGAGTGPPRPRSPQSQRGGLIIACGAAGAPVKYPQCAPFQLLVAQAHGAQHRYLTSAPDPVFRG